MTDDSKWDIQKAWDLNLLSTPKFFLLFFYAVWSFTQYCLIILLFASSQMTGLSSVPEQYVLKFMTMELIIHDFNTFHFFRLV